jgi:hypothetical protein
MNGKVVKLFLMALVLSLGSYAFADTMTYQIGIGNSAITPATYGLPYGTVLVNRTSTTTAVFTFTANSGYLFLDSGIAAANINATTFSLSNITGTLFSGAATPLPASGGAGQEDGWGNFNLTLDQTDGYTDAMTTLSFTVTDVSGTWAAVSNVLAPNSLGNVIAAHVGICNTNPCSPGGAGGGFFNNTGFASETGATHDPVPEPSTLWLLGSGFLALPAIARRWMPKTAA